MFRILTKIVEIEKQRARIRKHYRENTQYYKDKAKRRKQELKEWYISLKSNKKCLRCEECDRRCLDYHHRKPKEKKYDVSQMVVRNFSKEKILTEMKKCDLICSNCHRKLTLV